MANVNDVLDMKSLEKELQSCIEKDRLYWQQNDAKIRAVSEQRVTSYEEFRGLVSAAHLKPLEKSDRLTSDRHKVVWNPVCLKKRCSDPEPRFNKETFPNDTPGSTTTSLNFVKRLKSCAGPRERYDLLKTTGAERIGAIFKAEVPVGVLGDILECLQGFPQTTGDVVSTVAILDALTETNRFSLSLEFLSCTEKGIVNSLMSKLGCSLENRQQDLAELGVTEWTITALSNKYRIHSLRHQEISSKTCL